MTSFVTSPGVLSPTNHTLFQDQCFGDMFFSSSMLMRAQVSHNDFLCTHSAKDKWSICLLIARYPRDSDVL